MNYTTLSPPRLHSGSCHPRMRVSKPANGSPLFRSNHTTKLPDTKPGRISVKPHSLRFRAQGAFPRPAGQGSPQRRSSGPFFPHVATRSRPPRLRPLTGVRLQVRPASVGPHRCSAHDPANPPSPAPCCGVALLTGIRIAPKAASLPPDAPRVSPNPIKPPHKACGRPLKGKNKAKSRGNNTEALIRSVLLSGGAPSDSRPCKVWFILSAPPSPSPRWGKRPASAPPERTKTVGTSPHTQDTGRSPMASPMPPSGTVR